MCVCVLHGCICIFRGVSLSSAGPCSYMSIQPFPESRVTGDGAERIVQSIWMDGGERVRGFSCQDAITGRKGHGREEMEGVLGSSQGGSENIPSTSEK